MTKKPVCVVIGIGPGNGQAFARKFADDGFAIALLSRKTDLSEQIAAELEEARAYACDVVDPASIASAFAKVREELGRVGTATTGFEDLKNIAIGRLFLDNIPHVKTHWPMVTPFMSQVALAFGCDDVEGTVVFERI